MHDLLMQVKKDAACALEEDVGSGDVTAALLSSQLEVKAELVSRESMFISGQPWVNEVFHQINPSITLQWHVQEGSWITNPSVLCTIKGRAVDILTAERSALNFLQTLSATATQTYFYVQKIKHTKTQLLDTRKTLPKLRIAQKYAVLSAGGLNHRMGLYDAYLIKENHIKACGSIVEAVSRARTLQNNLLIEVEVETLKELEQALKAQADRILLDNFNINMLHEAVVMTDSQTELEASGGITLQNICDIAETGVNFVSVGAITKSIQAIDLSLLIRNNI